jgi:hypothetical protein
MHTFGLITVCIGLLTKAKLHQIKHNPNLTWLTRNMEIKQEDCPMGAWLSLATARPRPAGRATLVPCIYQTGP